MKIRVLALPLLAGAAFLAGCTGAPNTTPTPTPTSNGVEALAAADIVTKSTDALNKASSYRLKGSVTDNGAAVQIDMLVVGADRKMNVTAVGLTMEVLKISGATYVKSDDFWAQVASAAIPDQAQRTQALTLIKGKYVKLTAELETQLADFVPDAETILKPSSGAYTKGEATTIDGKPAITLTDADGNKLYVATTGEPYALRLETKTGDKIDVLEIGNKATITAPSASDVIDSALFIAAAAGK